MVSRNDLRTVNEQSRELQEALDELEELHEMEQRDGVTVDPSEYEAAQTRLQDAVAELVRGSDDMIDRTDVLENDDGETLVDLPAAALSRDGSDRTLPSAGGNG